MEPKTIGFEPVDKLVMAVSAVILACTIIIVIIT